MSRFSALLLCPLAEATSVRFSAGAGYDASAYDNLVSVLEGKLGKLGAPADGAQLCMGHSSDGVQPLLREAASDTSKCDAGIVALAAAPSPQEHENVTSPVLVIAGTLDGHLPFSHFAAARHRAAGMKGRRFAAIPGASHRSFASGTASQLVSETDLEAELSEDVAFAFIADIVHDFVRGGGASLDAAEKDAAELAGPIADALEYEGSSALGKPACNSDWPTNPACQYPKYPDHSTPFGPSPAPDPALPSDCICGSNWVMDAGAMAYDVPYSSFTNDAFHDVSDTHPFHLPNIFSGCNYQDASCVVNTTTVTMPVLKNGDFWPSGKSAPLSAFEFKTKFKSREAVRSKVGDPTSSSDLDNVNDMCKNINQAAFDWALSHSEDSARSRFESSGEPMVMVDDVEATIGITGPEWIKDELVYRRVDDGNSPTGSRLEVQSWKFVVGNLGNGSLPWWAPVGMHYCKLLSPARAMEWIYTDSMRVRKNSIVV